MDVAGVKVPDLNLPAAGSGRGSGTGQAEGTAKAVNSSSTDNTGGDKAPVKLTQDDLVAITQELNKFMETMNAGIQFKIHDKTRELMVQVVDGKDQQVLKEFPPHQLLDTIAAIRDYVGALLDKKV